MSASSCQILGREAEFSLGITFLGGPLLRGASSFLQESEPRPYRSDGRPYNQGRPVSDAFLGNVPVRFPFKKQSSDLRVPARTRIPLALSRLERYSTR